MIVVLYEVSTASIRCRIESMNSTKIQRVRRLIADGVYTNSDILDSIEEILVHRHYDRLMRDIESHSELAEDRCDEIAVGLYSQIVVDLKHCPEGNRKRYDDAVADVVASSLGKLAEMLLMRNGILPKSRLAT